MVEWSAELEAAEAERAAAFEARVKEIRQLLEQLAMDLPADEWEERTNELVALSIDDAARVRRIFQAVEKGDDTAVELADVIRRKLRTLRVQTGWAQRQLAEEMRRDGFGWQRITVAEVESGRRRPSLEELLALAYLFEVDLYEILGSFEPGESCRLNDTKAISASEVRERLKSFGVEP